MNFRFILFLSFFFPFLAISQERKDSIYIYDLIHKELQQNLLLHNVIDQTNFGEIELKYNREQGPLRLSQQPYSKNNYNFYAYGVNDLKKFRLSGDFYFNKTTEDSLAYFINNDLNPLATFYQYAGKAGSYERQNYRANLTVSYAITKQLRPFILVNYLYHWSTGSIDPRLDSKVFDLKYNPGLIFTIGQHSVSANAVMGTQDEKQNIAYKNKNFNQSLMFPDRINYMNLGYGYISIKDTLNTNKYSKYSGIAMNYRFKSPENDLILKGEYTRMNQDISHSSSKKFRINRARYTQNTTDLEAKWINTSNHLKTLSYTFQKINGYDGLSTFSKNFDVVNYEVDMMKHSLNYAILFKWQPIALEVGAEGEYFDLKRQDHTQFLNVMNSYYEVRPFATLYKTWKNNDVLKFKIVPKFRNPVKDELTISSNSLNNFTRDVVFTDYYYYKARLWGSSIQASYFTGRLSKNYLISMDAGYQFMKSSGKTDPMYEAAFYPHGIRSMFSIALRLHL